MLDQRDSAASWCRQNFHIQSYKRGKVEGRQVWEPIASACWRPATLVGFVASAIEILRVGIVVGM